MHEHGLAEKLADAWRGRDQQSVTSLPKQSQLRFGIFLEMGAILLLGGLAVFMPQNVTPYFAPQRSIRELLPEAVPGWDAHDMPLGETEYVQKSIERALQFDDAAYWVYRLGDLEVGVYVAYWKPGKLDPWLVALHTPESCWVLAGAQMQERDDQRKLPSAQSELWPAQYRQFQWPDGALTQVVFWHLYGGHPNGIPVTGDEGRWRARWTKLAICLRNARFGRIRREQVFVRISTNRSIDAVKRSDLWPLLVSRLSATGVLSVDTQ
jgi:hypothetical protein